MLGVSFAVQFLQKYYNLSYFHFLMVWYAIMTVYTSIGILALINHRLFSKIMLVRSILIS